MSVKLKIFAIYDSKAECYRTPIFAGTVGEMLRPLTDAVNKEDHELHIHAADFTMFEIGEFDCDTGKVIPIEPSSIGNLLEFRNPKKADPRQIDILEKLEKSIAKLQEII